MKIYSHISNINTEQWRLLAQKSQTATWFQTCEAYDFYASLPQMMTPFVFAVEENDELYGVVVGYITKEKSTVKQYFTRRGIIIGGPLLRDDISAEALQMLLNAVVKNLQRKCIYIETRNFNSYEKWKADFVACGFAYNEHLNFHVDTSTPEIVQSNLGKSRKRDIKTSFREGVRILENPTLQQVTEFFEILNHLYKTKVKTPLFDFVFFEKLYKLPSAHFLLVERDNEILGGTVCVGSHKTLYEWFACGKDGAYKNIYPSTVATFSGISYAANKGFVRFDMMGAGKPNEGYGVRDFKAKFGGELVENGRFVCVTSKILYKIGQFGVELLKKI